MMDYNQRLVEEYHRKFEHTINTEPTIPSYEDRKLRATLILEEAIETISALGFTMLASDLHPSYGPVSLIDIADGVADLEYVTKGTAVTCGLDSSKNLCEVHRSNMSKLWTTNDLLGDSLRQRLLQKLQLKNHTIKCVFCQNTFTRCTCNNLDTNTRQWLVKNGTGKSIKSPSYSPPNLKAIICTSEI
jgi:predicted HAD superfamily Cof-like phosphohydrolase